MSYIPKRGPDCQNLSCQKSTKHSQYSCVVVFKRTNKQIRVVAAGKALLLIHNNWSSIRYT